MQTTVAPAETKNLPLPQIMCVVVVTAMVTPGESGGGAFYFAIPGISGDYTVPDGDNWSLEFQNLGIADAYVKNTGGTSLVFTTPDGA